MIKPSSSHRHSDIGISQRDVHVRKVERIFKNWEPRRFLRQTKQRLRNPQLRQAVLITQTMDGNFELCWYNQSRVGNDLALLELATASTLDKLMESWRISSGE